MYVGDLEPSLSAPAEAACTFKCDGYSSLHVTVTTTNDTKEDPQVVMMYPLTIEGQIGRIVAAKSSIMEAVNGMGGDIDSGDTLDVYAEKISSVGGGLPERVPLVWGVTKSIPFLSNASSYNAQYDIKTAQAYNSGSYVLSEASPMALYEGSFDGRQIREGNVLNIVMMTSITYSPMTGHLPSLHVVRSDGTEDVYQSASLMAKYTQYSSIVLEKDFAISYEGVDFSDCVMVKICHDIHVNCDD